jgi:NADH:ubiquinone oxidoreductase subunit 4 (subunit M)
VGNDHVKALTDINSREFLMLALLAVAVLAMGLYPKPLHRRDGHLGGRVAQARGPVQAELTRLN